MGVDCLREGGAVSLGLATTPGPDLRGATWARRVINQHPSPHKPTKLNNQPAPIGLVFGASTGVLAGTLKDSAPSTDSGASGAAIEGVGGVD